MPKGAHSGPGLFLPPTYMLLIPATCGMTTCAGTDHAACYPDQMLLVTMEQHCVCHPWLPRQTSTQGYPVCGSLSLMPCSKSISPPVLPAFLHLLPLPLVLLSQLYQLHDVSIRGILIKQRCPLVPAILPALAPTTVLPSRSFPVIQPLP